jgi:soluble lytic murein transglycosylase-like protein
MSTLTPEMDNMLSAAARAYGVDVGLFKGMIEGESSFNPLAVSPTGAKGLGQLFPAAMTDVRRKYGISGPVFDPSSNANMAAAYLKMMLDQNKGNVVNALGSYNQGFGGFRNPKTHGLGLDYAKYILGKASKHGFQNQNANELALDNLYLPKQNVTQKIPNTVQYDGFASLDSDPVAEKPYELKDPIADLMVRGSVVDEVINRIFGGVQNG